MKKILSTHQSGFSLEELKIVRALSTPAKIQDFVNLIPINFSKNGDTLYSPRRVLRERKAHCVEGALLAAAALQRIGHKPLLMDLKTVEGDSDHVVALFKEKNRWGAISKTNHIVLRYREPVYASPRELAMSYFHEYFLDTGKKTMRSFSRPFDLSRNVRKDWMIAEDDLWEIALALDDSPHENILAQGQARRLRNADPIEIQAGKIEEWHK
jgi:hypothetical protein